MDPEIISGIKNKFPGFIALSISQDHPDELCIKVAPEMFKSTCLTLHKVLPSPVMMFFASDNRKADGTFEIKCVFLSAKLSQWVLVSMDIPGSAPSFESFAKEVHSSSLFEREIYEMFGVEPKGSPDLRSLNLHDEVWPKGNYPLRKDFKEAQGGAVQASGEYKFARVEGDGVFEVPVGPVHAGIIGPGHFRFSVAGEPIINLELRLGFTHRGVEKLFEGKSCLEAVKLAERVSGDASFAHSLAFTTAAEKILGIQVNTKVLTLRAIFLELERMYNHVNDMGGIATDVGFSFPAAYAAIIKEAILQLNEKLTGSRYLKDTNTVGGVAGIDEAGQKELLGAIKKIRCDLNELVKILNSTVSFMDRVDTTGVLRRKTAEDLGAVGLAARASGIPTDLRKLFPGVYKEAKFKLITQSSGDVLARLRVRISEFEESCRLVEEFAGKLGDGAAVNSNAAFKAGAGLGYAEGWRGPVLYWVKADASGMIERCKIVDPSFHNWQTLSYAVLGNIIPDFPLCNKSFDLSYSGNDL